MAPASLLPISEFLSSLKPTGQSGFEGLIVTLCENFTGQRFRLSGSGSQTGQDARSEPGYGNAIKVEAKHYTKSSLDLRELTAELVQAVQLGPDTDLWVLAASCEVMDQHASALESLAHKFDVEVLFLDSGTNDLPRVAVLMAAGLEALEGWILKNKLPVPMPLRAALEDLRSHARFNETRDGLARKMQSCLLGYADARRRTAERLLGTLRATGESSAVFNQNVAVKDPTVQLIPRLEISDQLVRWWASPGGKRGVVLGEEGTGKTWAVMSWLAERVEAGTMPIVLPFSADAESFGAHDTLEDLLPRLMARWTGLGTVSSWAARVERWLSDPSLTPLVLVIVDGLNERPMISWPSFLRTLDRDRWQRHVAVLATDRPGHWRPACANAGLDGFKEIDVTGYTDWELEKALAGRQITISSIPPDLHPLIRKPRYCELVCAYFSEMKAHADFTVERLIWLDAKHRAQARRGPMTEETFIEVIRNLAAAYRTSPTVNLSGVQQLVPFADPERRIHQEIIDGGLLVPQPGLGSRFQIERTRLVFGLGMLLADDLRISSQQTKTAAELDEEIARWFEPHPEMDLKVRICGGALFHSLIDAAYPSTARRQLLRYWLGLRNWSDEVQEAFQDYVLRCPEDFIGVTAEFWSSEHDRGAAQEFLARAFIKHRDAPTVQPPLVAAVTRWMSFVHPAGHPMLRSRPDQEERQRREIAARLGATPQAGSTDILGEPLEIIEDDALLRLSRFGFLLISAGSRLPYLKALVRWSIASAVMGTAMESSVAGWVIRMADEPIEQELLAEARRLLAVASPVADEAAHTLLWAIDTAEARNLREEHPTPEPEHWVQMQEQHKIDPCTSFLAWSNQDCLRCLHREDISLLSILDRLGDRLYDPSYPIPDSLVGRAGRLLEIDPTLMRASLGATVEQHGYERALRLLASRAPAKAAEFLRTVVVTLPDRQWERAYPLAIWLPEIGLVLGPSELERVREFLEKMRGQLVDCPPDISGEPWSSRRAAEAFAFMATVPHLTPAEFLSSLLARPRSTYDLRQFESLFEALSEDGVETALHVVRTAPDETSVVRALWFLGASKVSLSDDDRDRIVALAGSKSAVLRGAARRFVRLVEDEELGRRLVDLGDSFVKQLDTWDVMWGARALTRFSSHLAFEEIARRLHPADAGFALVQRGNRPDEVKLYALSLHQTWQSIVAATDPGVLGLPVVIADTAESRLGSEFPEFDQERADSVTFKNPSTTWMTPGPGNDIAATFQNPGKQIEEINRLCRQRVENIAAAWQTEALQWYGRDFSRSALRAICQEHPTLVSQWAEPALKDSPIGQIHRLRFGSLLAKLCPSLLEFQPTLGLHLWRVLRAEANSAVVCDSTFVAFAAADNACTNEARWQVINESANDATIGRIACAAEAMERTACLRSAVSQMIADARLWRKAKGLTLASFMNLTEEEFEAYVTAAGVDNTWVGSQLEWLRGNVRRNRFAQHWFRVFLETEDADTCWGAWQMVKFCADQRLFVWWSAPNIPAESTAAHRLRFFQAQQDRLEHDIDRDQKRKDTLFGIKIEAGEIFPFFQP